MKIIRPKRIKNVLYQGNKPSDGEVKVAPKPKKPQGSRRPRNKGRG